MEKENFEITVMDRFTVLNNNRVGASKSSYISVNRNDGRIVFTELMQERIKLRCGDAVSFVFSKENNYVFVTKNENGFVLRLQGKDRGAVMFSNKAVAAMIHDNFKSSESSLKLKAYPEPVIINDDIVAWELLKI